VPPKPSYGRLVVFGLVGALAASGVAVLLALQLAKPDIPAAAFAGEPRASDAPEPPPAVEGLRASRGRWTADPDSWRVSLSWRPAEGAVRYLVSRGGRPLDEVTEPRFVDESVTPEGLYRYQVVAVDVDSDRSPPSRVRVVTGSLPKAAARVQGRWILRLKIRSSTISQGGGRVVVTLMPTCPEGPCAVGWAFRGLGNTGTATAQGATYSGSGSGDFLTLDCHGAEVSATVSMEFRVVTAHTVGTGWRATEIAGELTESVPSVSNCLSATNVWTFTGSAQG